MKPNLSDHQFLEADDIIVVQTAADPDQDYSKVDTKNVKIESLREDIRNYVDKTTTKELKVFTSGRSITGGRIDVLDNETLYYYPATPVGELNDVNIKLTTSNSIDFFSDIDNQKEYNEKMHKYASDIELSLETNNKFLDAIIASTEFVGPDDAPDHVKHFETYNAYPPSGNEKELVVNVNDLTSVDERRIEGDEDLQNQINDAENRISALFNVKLDSGYFVYEVTDPTIDLPGPGQIKVSGPAGDERDLVIHARSYVSDYDQPELADEAETLNNYIVVNPGDTIVSKFQTYSVVSVSLVDENVPLDERIFIINATLTRQDEALVDGEFTAIRVVADGEFDPASLEGVYVKTTGDDMTGELTIRRPNSSVCLKVENSDGAPGLSIYSGGKTITERTVFEAQEYVTKTFVQAELASADLDSYVKIAGDTMKGPLYIRNTDGKSGLNVNIIDSGQNSNLQMKRNNDTYISLNNNPAHIFLHKTTRLNVEGTADKDLVTKKYVDDKVNNINIPDVPAAPDLSGYVKSKTNQYTISRDSNGQYYIEQ